MAPNKLKRITFVWCDCWYIINEENGVIVFPVLWGVFLVVFKDFACLLGKLIFKSISLVDFLSCNLELQ